MIRKLDDLGVYMILHANNNNWDIVAQTYVKFRKIAIQVLKEIHTDYSARATARKIGDQLNRFAEQLQPNQFPNTDILEFYDSLKEIACMLMSA